jgi:hypothetical protein
LSFNANEKRNSDSLFNFHVGTTTTEVSDSKQTSNVSGGVDLYNFFRRSSIISDSQSSITVCSPVHAPLSIKTATISNNIPSESGLFTPLPSAEPDGFDVEAYYLPTVPVKKRKWKSTLKNAFKRFLSN